MKKVIIGLIIITAVYATNRGNKFIYIEDNTYDYIDYLINRGDFSPQFIFQQPYKLFEFTDSTLFHNQWTYHYGTKHIAFYGGMDNRLLTAGDHRKHLYHIKAGAHYTSDDLILANRTHMDTRYKYDPWFPGDLSESEDWLYGRVNDAYLDLTIDQFNFFIGRMKRNWGPVNHPSLILSSNPYNYDQVNFNYNTDFFRFSLIYARLEDAATGRTFFGRDSTYTDHENVRKHITGHRVDVHFSDKFQLALTEMAIYGGEDREFELAYANPMNFYYGIQRNQGKGMSGLWAVDLFYKPIKPLTFYTQFMIDDIIVNNDPGVDDRGRYPDRFALTVSARSGDLFLDGLNIGVSYVKVWNDTYQSRRTWENYHYEGLGLGYPEVACEEGQLNLGYWRFYPFYLTNKLIYGRYGDADLKDIFLLKIRDFPVAPVTHNLYNQLTLNYQFRRNLTCYLEYTYLRDTNHYLNRSTLMGHHNIEFGIDYVFARGVFY